MDKNLYEKYQTDYDKMISAAQKEHPENEMIIKPHIWIFLKYLTDNHCEIYENEKIAWLLSKLKQENEIDMIECLTSAYKEIVELL